MTPNKADRTQTHAGSPHQETLHASGLRPVQIWVPDTHRADFDAICHRQALAVAKADGADRELHDLLDETLDEIAAWTP